MLGEGSTSLQQQTLGGGKQLTQFAVTQLFLVAALMQSGFMGLVAGVFEEGDIISGIKHSFIMITVAWFVFKFIVTGI
jgi:flagellar protein FlaJ